MASWQKRFVISINSAILFVFLDISLLIFIRSVNTKGTYQTIEMKWLTFLSWAFCYAFIWICQGIIYFLFNRSKKRK